MDVVGGGRIHPAEAGASVRREPEAAAGAPLRPRSPHADAGTPHRFGAFGASGHACQPAETLRQIARKTPRMSLRAGGTLPGRQENRLTPNEDRNGGSFAMGFMYIAKLPEVKTQA